MPLYSYKCESCGHDFDKQLKIAEMNLPESEPCPNCSATTVKKYIAGLGGFNADVVKVDGGFREVIQKIKSANRINNLPDY